MKLIFLYFCVVFAVSSFHKFLIKISNVHPLYQGIHCALNVGKKLGEVVNVVQLETWLKSIESKRSTFDAVQWIWMFKYIWFTRQKKIFTEEVLASMEAANGALLHDSEHRSLTPATRALIKTASNDAFKLIEDIFTTDDINFISSMIQQSFHGIHPVNVVQVNSALNQAFELPLFSIDNNGKSRIASGLDAMKTYFQIVDTELKSIHFFGANTEDSLIGTINKLKETIVANDGLLKEFRNSQVNIRNALSNLPQFNGHPDESIERKDYLTNLKQKISEKIHFNDAESKRSTFTTIEDAWNKSYELNTMSIAIDTKLKELMKFKEKLSAIRAGRAYPSMDVDKYYEILLRIVAMNYVSKRILATLDAPIGIVYNKMLNELIEKTPTKESIIESFPSLAKEVQLYDDHRDEIVRHFQEVHGIIDDFEKCLNNAMNSRTIESVLTNLSSMKADYDSAKIKLTWLLDVINPKSAEYLMKIFYPADHGHH